MSRLLKRPWQVMIQGTGAQTGYTTIGQFMSETRDPKIVGPKVESYAAEHHMLGVKWEAIPFRPMMWNAAGQFVIDPVEDAKYEPVRGGEA